MDLIMSYDFIQVLNIKRRHSIKNKYFSNHIQFTTIYFLQKLKLKYNNYSEEETNMSYFVQSIEHDMSMHARFGD
jgi:hypothetical protein